MLPRLFLVLSILILAAPPVAIAKMPMPKVPEGFEVTIFAQPPDINYPACIFAAPTGELFVGSDPQGSLGKDKDFGKIYRCLDTDGDGKADKFNIFAEVDHPRGLHYDNGKLWVLHPPFLTVYHDDDRDGKADRSEQLVENLSTVFNERRGADHTTNGIRMGIDGWLYIAVGDFGFANAKGKDGKELTLLGGGVARVRPDGTELEIYAKGLRNIYDVAIDPYLNCFTRDNTNDGGGWDIRLSHIIQTAHYGYPSHFKNFTDEIMHPLAQYGGGSGCGAMYVHDLTWPKQFGDALYTCDWGTSKVYLHNLKPNGASFDPHQEVFADISRPTDIDMSADGQLFISSWHGGQYRYGGENVGFVARVVPKGWKPSPRLRDLGKTDAKALIEMLKSPSANVRLHAQQEILRRDRSDKPIASGLAMLAYEKTAPPYARVAAIFTMKQRRGAASCTTIAKLAADPNVDVAVAALRALTDRKGELKNVAPSTIVKALASKNEQIRAQAIISAGRIGDPSLANAVMQAAAPAAQTAEPAKPVPHHQPNPAGVLGHLAMKSLVAMNAVDQCLAAIDGPHGVMALRALQSMHNDRAVDGLVERYQTANEPVKRRTLVAALIRLYQREAEYDGSRWWGTRPDTRGPYYKPVTWEKSKDIEVTIREAFSAADATTQAFYQSQLRRHRADIKGLTVAQAKPVDADDQPEVDIAKIVAESKTNAKGTIGQLDFETIVQRTSKVKGDATLGEKLFTQQGCIACHTTSKDQALKGPYLGDIVTRYSKAELITSIVKPNATVAQGFDTDLFELKDGDTIAGFVVREAADDVELRTINGVRHTIAKKDIAERNAQELSSMPEGIVANLKPEELAAILAYLQKIHDANSGQ